MSFSETIFPPGKILYKGFGKISCSTLLRDTRFFYLTEDKSAAKDYGHLCNYRVKRTLRLFDLSHSNIEKLIRSGYPLSKDTKGLLRVVMGTGVTVGEQAVAAHILMGDAAGALPKLTNRRPGQRLSYTKLNKKVLGSLARDFLIPEGYDGYYSPKKPSIFHGGSFHSEIMVNNAYQTIERTSGGAPVVSRRSFKWAIPGLFLEFTKRTKRLVKPYGGGVTLFCTGGMAVRTYLAQKLKTLPEKIRRTSDFDFTFAVPRNLPSDKSVATYVYFMRKIMTEHLVQFLKWINSKYKGINARLLVNKFARTKYSNPRDQVPGTKRKVYQVISYQILTGKDEVTDLVDTALAVYPGSSRSMLHLPYSYKTGIPIQKLRWQLKDSLALLSGSFLYKGIISQRNPISGKKKEKGEKNFERVVELAKIGKKNASLRPLIKAAGPLLQNVIMKNRHAAKKNARGVNKALKKII